MASWNTLDDAKEVTIAVWYVDALFGTAGRLQSVDWKVLIENPGNSPSNSDSQLKLTSCPSFPENTVWLDRYLSLTLFTY